jgi:hypothetical protein
MEIVTSNTMGVPYGLSSFADDQNKAWERNMECTTAPLEPYETQNKIEVDATICDTGDVLVRVSTPERKGIYRWVYLESVLSNSIVDSGTFFMSSAVADTSGMANPNFSGQMPGDARPNLTSQYRSPSNTNEVVRELKYPNSNRCKREYVNTYSGVVSREEYYTCY